MTQARQPDMFPSAPRRPRRWMMHVADAGHSAVQFKCGRCGHDSGRLKYDEDDSVSKLKRGLPCPKCNAP